MIMFPCLLVTVTKALCIGVLLLFSVLFSAKIAPGPADRQVHTTAVNNMRLIMKYLLVVFCGIVLPPIFLSRMSGHFLY